MIFGATSWRPLGRTLAVAFLLSPSACDDGEGATSPSVADAARADASRSDSGTSMGTPAGVDAGGPAALRVITGKLPLYHTQMGKPRNDASGLAVIPGTSKILVVDDGGDDTMPDLLPFYTFDVASLFSGAVAAGEVPAAADLPTSVAARHRDMEALTADDRFLYVMSSLAPERTDPEFGVFSRFAVKDGRIDDATTIEPRDVITAALKRPTTDSWFAAWLARWEKEKSKDGALNVEALTVTPRTGQLLVGLRSPHYGQDYMTPLAADPTKKNTRTGAAILVSIDVNKFENASLSPAVHATLDLGGLGFRGLEYVPAAGGYFITAGAVEAGWDYDFFFWKGDPASKPVRLTGKIPELAKLCRPESVAQVSNGGKTYVLFLSEDSGAICEMPAAPYNFVLVEIDDALKERLTQ